MSICCNVLCTNNIWRRIGVLLIFLKNAGLALFDEISIRVICINMLMGYLNNRQAEVVTGRRRLWWGVKILIFSDIYNMF